MPVKTRGKATDPLTKTEFCHAQVLQIYRRTATSTGAGIQHVFSPSKLAPNPGFSKTFDAELRYCWRDAREAT
jgi:hypothetical protein